MPSVIDALEILDHNCTILFIPAKDREGEGEVITVLCAAIILRAEDYVFPCLTLQPLGCSWQDRTLHHIYKGFILHDRVLYFGSVTVGVSSRRGVHTDEGEFVFVGCPCVDFLVFIINFGVQPFQLLSKVRANDSISYDEDAAFFSFLFSIVFELMGRRN